PQRHVMLREAAADAVRQLRDMAQDAGVEVRLAPELPDIEVNAAAVELCLTNLVSNGIKYADPAKSERWVEVNGHLLPEGAQVASATDLVVTVRSNGIPVPESERENLFRRFFRTADAASSAVKGTGLGLSIVRATVEDLGGRAWVEFPDGGAVFSFSFPLNACPRSLTGVRLGLTTQTRRSRPTSAARSSPPSSRKCSPPASCHAGSHPA